MSDTAPSIPARAAIEAQTVGDALRQAALAYGSAPYVRFGDETISFADANRRANRVANAFSAMGVRAGDRVAIFSHNRLEYLDLWFGLSKIGAIELPISTAYKTRQIAHVLSRANVRALVADDRCATAWLKGDLGSVDLQLTLDGARSDFGALDYQSVVARASDEEPHSSPIDPGDIVAIMNTSGTTGPSKGVRLRHAQQLSLARNMARELAISREDVFYNYFPLFHNTAQAMIALSSLLSGGRMLLTERFSLSAFWDDVRKHDVSLFYFIGEMLHLLVNADAGAAAAQGRTTLRAGWGIGARPTDVAAFQHRHNVKLGTGYGSTEGNVPVFRPVGIGASSAAAGYVAPGFRVRIVDAQGTDVEVGEVGEIIETADDPNHIMAGYDGDPQASADALRDGWFRTGDAGFFDENGAVYFVSRIKDVIRVGGENISGSEIEEAALAFAGVREAAAIAVPAARGGDDVKLVFVAEEGAEIEFGRLVGHCAAILPKYAVPRYIERRDHLPKTETNKVQKNILRQEGVTPTTWDRHAERGT